LTFSKEVKNEKKKKNMVAKLSQCYEFLEIYINSKRLWT
jgi:hypothetical protein